MSGILTFVVLSGCAPDTSVDWTTKYAPELAFLNRSNIAVPVFSAPDVGSTPLGSVRPNDGGFIQTCNRDASWCKISYSGFGAAGWVNMTPFFATPI